MSRQEGIHGAGTAIVTGASSGIGLAFAERLAREGHDLVVVARRVDRLDALAKDLREQTGVDVEVIPADLTEAAGLRSVEDRVSRAGAMSLLVNSAGFGTSGPLIALDPDEEESEIRLNVIALVRLTRAALPGMVARGRGGIINVSSLAGMSPGPYAATHAATKAFVNSFTEAVYEEVRGTGVRVQLLCPGFTRTGFQTRAGVSADAVPGFLWMTADAVVEESLAALRSDRMLVVPGIVNRSSAALAGLLPRSWTRRLSASLGRRLEGREPGA